MSRDPQGTRTDAELISALQRAWLLPKDGPTDPVIEAKFSLDSTVGDEGETIRHLSKFHAILILISQVPITVLAKSNCLLYAVLSSKTVVLSS